uniref:Uncharacterized protein n=1 Tax=Alexandrium andersonii TaxID=327968 RepID=A0A7S2CTK5_9DINO|mmetsp:Transcript_43177/g.98018  ORF Transcript_43177/g.98018 Transcript_43177/m.98018 type:complete len:111 (+) Transcript_43177:118-450(+)
MASMRATVLAFLILVVPAPAISFSKRLNAEGNSLKETAAAVPAVEPPAASSAIPMVDADFEDEVLPATSLLQQSLQLEPGESTAARSVVCDERGCTPSSAPARGAKHEEF